MSHFLAIDDEVLVLKSLSMLLEALGHSVTVAASGTEAVSLIRDAPEPDGIIADYRLRDGETGLVAVEKVRQALGGPVPALILTGDTAPDRVLEIHRSGLKVLHKPIGINDLMDALDALVAVGDDDAPGSSGHQYLRH